AQLKQRFAMNGGPPNFESLFQQMDEMMRQLDSFLLGPGMDDARHDNGWQWPLFPRSEQPPLNNPNESSGSSTNPRDRLLKSTPEPKSTLPPVPLPADRRDVDLDSEPRWRLGDEPFREDADEPVLPSRDFNSGGGGSWFSGRMEHSVRESDGTVRRTVTTVGPDGRRSSVTTVETPDGRVTTSTTDGERDGDPRSALTRRDDQWLLDQQQESDRPSMKGLGSWFRSWFG
ncbi:hypothetical protein BOX15_Mlig019815g2, partial [Macrostomum lignano]